MRSFAVATNYRDPEPEYTTVQVPNVRALAAIINDDAYGITLARLAWREGEVTDGSLHIVPMQ